MISHRDVAISVSVLQLLVDFGMEVDELVEVHMREIVNLVSLTMPNVSL